MDSWQLQDARAHLSEVVDRALAEGPQRITRRGRAAVVVVSEEAWERSKRSAGFGDLLAACPLAADDLPPRRPARAVRDGGDG